MTQMTHGFFFFFPLCGVLLGSFLSLSAGWAYSKLDGSFLALSCLFSACQVYFEVGWLFLALSCVSFCLLGVLDAADGSSSQVCCKFPCCFVTDAARSCWTRYSLFAIFLCFADS